MPALWDVSFNGVAVSAEVSGATYLEAYHNAKRELSITEDGCIELEPANDEAEIIYQQFVEAEYR